MNLSLTVEKCRPATMAGPCTCPQRVLPCPGCTDIRTILPAELADRLRATALLILLDCRSFVAYNLSHISGALNVSCVDRFSKRRLTCGKASVGDMVTGRSDAKETFRELAPSANVVLYDDSTEDPTDLPPGSSLSLVFTSLQREGKNAYVLRGKYP